MSGELLTPNWRVAKTKLQVAEKREKTARRRRGNFENMSLYGGGWGREKKSTVSWLQKKKQSYDYVADPKKTKFSTFGTLSLRQKNLFGVISKLLGILVSYIHVVYENKI